MEKKEYRSAMRSKRLIREALIKLMGEKELKKITVSDIVKEADINRSTFYAHYPDVYGLLDEIGDEIAEETLEAAAKIEYVDVLKNPGPFLEIVNTTLNSHADFFRALITSNYADQFSQKMKRIFFHYAQGMQEIPEEIRQSRSFHIKMNFFFAGVVDTYMRWFCGDLDCSLEEVTMELNHIMVELAMEFLLLK